MIRSTHTVLALAAAGLLFSVAATTGAKAATLTKGLGDPGELKSILVEQGSAGQPLLLRSRDARQQLCVTGVFATGQVRDFTHRSTMRLNQRAWSTLTPPVW